MTEVLDVTVVARQAFAIGVRPTADAPIQTRLHVPGSVLRGALAAAWINEYGEPDPLRPGRAVIPPGRRAEFEELFERKVRFGPLLAVGSSVVPLSVKRCKYADEGDLDDPCRTALQDEAFGQTGRTCPSCDGPTVHGRGEVEFFDTARAGRAEKTRLALTDGETSADGMLYTRQALRPFDREPGRDGKRTWRSFTGQIVGSNSWLGETRRIHIGGRRSTSGAADYSARPAGNRPAPIEDDRLVLRLTTPAILVDRAGRPVDVPDTTLLSEQLGVKVTVGRRWVRTTTVGGWHAASNLPKPDELAVTAGSVFELLLDDRPDPDAVEGLLRHGLGLRRGEGFGWIQAGPWHRPAAPTPPGDDESAGESDATVLFASGHGKWLMRELGRFLDQCRGEDRPGPYLLGRPILEEALQYSTFRETLHRILTRYTVQQITQVRQELENKVRDNG
ncbi:type III-B CRISPR module-associated Cmr3 family protein [Rhizohabitans arisaemae]|uniref:type III-B CRISPR module-associated Cmr3 family protein n=1 Tax=Rhizohabitans arisaemae TaxID=2720610 RepID=UPI0024B215C8|nr:type III-B CRISPR module-associated Cmr3 family protein [Rhizohabitans arisaemae]